MRISDHLGRLRSEALWVFAGQAMSSVSILAGVKILTHFLDPREYGRLSLAITIVNLIGMNFFGPLGQGLMRFWSISVDNNQLAAFDAVSKRYIGFVFLLVMIAGLFVLLGLLLTRTDWAALFLLSVLVGGLTGWSRIRLSILMAARKRKIVALVNSGTELSKPLVAAMLIVLFLSDVGYVMVGYLLTMGVSVAVAVRFYRRTYREAVSRSPTVQGGDQDRADLGGQILRFTIPFLIWGWFAWVHQSSDKWALVAYHGTHVVGGYAVISQLAVYPLLFCSNFLSSLFLPIAYERAGRLLSSEATQSANKILLLMSGVYMVGAALIVLVFHLFHRPIALMISNDSFAGFSHLLPALTVSWALYYLGQTVSGFGLLANRPRVYLVPIVLAGVLAAAMTFYLAPAYGPIGVICGLGVAGCVYALWCMAIAHRILVSEPVTQTGNTNAA